MNKKYDKSRLSQNYQRNLIKATVTATIGINNHSRLVKVYGAGAARVELLNKLQKQSKFTLWWFAIFYTLGLVCLILDPAGWFNVLDLFILMINIYLIARGKPIGVYIGILECCLYSFICLQTQLYGEVIKNMAISVPLNIYTIISWSISSRKQKNEKYIDKKKSDDIIIKKMKKKDYLIYGSLLVLFASLAFLLLKFGLKQKNAILLSSIALGISIVGKILTAQRYMESYVLFNIGSCICLLMWVQTMLQSTFSFADVTMIVYYLACITNDFYAYDLWKSMYRKIAVNGGVLLAMRKVNIKKIAKLRRQYRNLHWDKKIDMSKNS